MTVSNEWSIESDVSHVFNGNVCTVSVLSPLTQQELTC
jgi:hypothetical protein